MNISGAAIIRNGVKLGYPFIESIKSVLPLCSEFIIAVGDSQDLTRQKIDEINDPKIKVIETVWNMNNRSGGLILSEQTNIAMAKCSGDWIFYIQSDEVVHEKDYDNIKDAVSIAEKNKEIDGIAFNYLHFYGSYYTIQTGRNWYDKEVRIIRNGNNILSHGDAQGFRKNNKKINAISCQADVFHYGWARPPEIMAEKIKKFHAFWHDDKWIEKNCSDKKVEEFFSDLGNLKKFTGTHPFVMNDILNNDSEEFIEMCRQAYLKKRTQKELFRDWLRSLPFGRHRNFKLIKAL